MDIDHHEGESREEPLGFALGAAAQRTLLISVALCN
jgi:hypothetical protein